MIAGAVSIEWGFKIAGGKTVRKVPGAYSEADVYQQIQEDGKLWDGKKYQIVSREVSAWTYRETIKKEVVPK